MMNIINNYDLRVNKNKYTIAELEANINNLSMTILVNTQILTPAFCVKYILNEKYMDCGEEEYRLTFWYVLSKQPHITEKELSIEYDKVY